MIHFTIQIVKIDISKHKVSHGVVRKVSHYIRTGPNLGMNEFVPVDCDCSQDSSKDKDNSEEDSNACDAVDVGPHLLVINFQTKNENK